MTISTVDVAISVAQITGVALPNARVSFALTAADVNAGIVAPQHTLVVLASDGTGSASLWPNTLGTQGTQYKVTINDQYGALQYSGFATIPNSNCSLHNVIDLPAPGEITTLAAGFVTVTPPPGMTSTDAQSLFVELAQASTGITNLSYTASPTNGIVVSSTGTDATLPAADGTNAGLMLPAQVTKLAGVAAGATANSSDATLLARANHTGTQLAATISDFPTAADARVTAGLAGYATTAAVATSYAPLASPALTGTPTAPTAAQATNTTQLATTAFVQTVVTAAVAGLLDFKGATDCSASPNYPAALKGDSYIVSVAGKIGGASGTSVEVGDWIIATADNAGGTEASVGTSWGHMEHNLVGALLASNNLSDLANASTALSNLGLSANGKSLVTAADYAAMRVLLGLVIGTNVQATLVSATNIKTINSTSLLGSGDLVISAAPGGSNTQLQYNNSSAFGGTANITTDGTDLTLGSKLKVGGGATKGVFFNGVASTDAALVALNSVAYLGGAQYIVHALTGDGAATAAMRAKAFTASGGFFVSDDFQTSSPRMRSGFGGSGFAFALADNSAYVPIEASSFIGNAGLAVGTVTKSSSYTALTSNCTILCDATSGAIVITGFACASNAGKLLTVKKIDSSGNTVTFDPNASEQVDGASTKVLSAQWSSVTVQVNAGGTAWNIVSVV